MRVRVLHDDYIRLHVCPVLATESEVSVVPIEKCLLTASCKSVAGTWHSGDTVANLSKHPDYDVILTTSDATTHHIGIGRVIGGDTYELLHSVSVQGRHFAELSHNRECEVFGMKAVAKHLIAKTCGVPSVDFSVSRLAPFHSIAHCMHTFDGILAAQEFTYRRRPRHETQMTSMGSDAWRLFFNYNTSVTSRIASAFPTNSLDFAKSLSLSVGLQSTTHSPYNAELILSHTNQSVPVSATARQSLAALEHAADLKTTRLTLLDAGGLISQRRMIGLDEEMVQLLGREGLRTRLQTPMYVVFDMQHTTFLIADIDFAPEGSSSVSTPTCTSREMFDGWSIDGVVAAMHYVNVACAYHPTLEPRRQLLLRKCCGMLDRPSMFTQSICRMLRYESGPVLPLLAQMDFSPRTVH